MKNYIAVFVVAFCALAVNAQAQEQSVKIRFSKAVELPRMTLPAGTYTFTVPEDASGFVQVFTGDRQLVGTLQVAAAERQKVTDDTQVIFAERDGGMLAVKTIFVPGSNSGFELLYPRSEARELARDTTEVIDATPMSASGD